MVLWLLTNWDGTTLGYKDSDIKSRQGIVNGFMCFGHPVSTTYVALWIFVSSFWKYNSQNKIVGQSRLKFKVTQEAIHDNFWKTTMIWYNPSTTIPPVKSACSRLVASKLKATVVINFIKHLVMCIMASKLICKLMVRKASLTLSSNFF